MSYIDDIPDDEMTLAETEITELIKLWEEDKGRHRAVPHTKQHIEMMCRGPNRLPGLVYLRSKKNISSARK